MTAVFLKMASTKIQSTPCPFAAAYPGSDSPTARGMSAYSFTPKLGIGRFVIKVGF